MEKFLEDISGKNINFLIGSGASSPLYKTLSLGKDNPTFEDLLSSEGLNDENRKNLYVAYFNDIISKLGIDELEKSENDGNAVISSYNRFIKNILRILNREGLENKRKINIFTTNYDLLFEKTFDVLGEKYEDVYFNDGSQGFINKHINSNKFYINISASGIYDRSRVEIPLINLIKMHGSISWNKENNRIGVCYKNESFEKIKELLFEKLNATLLSEIESAMTKEKSNILAEKVEAVNSLLSEKSNCILDLDEFIEEYEKLAIINPNKFKFHDTVFEQHYYQLIRLFSYEMEREQTVLIVFGFSFADEHLEEILKRALFNPTLKVYIISYSKKGQYDMKEKFKVYFNSQIEYLPDFEETPNAKGDFEFLNNLLVTK